MTSPVRPSDDPVDPERQRASKEASVLFVLLAEAPDDADVKARIDAWCAQSTLHSEVWERTCRTYRMMGGSAAVYEAHWKANAGRPPSAAAAEMSVRARAGGPLGFRGRRGLLAVAGLAVAACLAIAVAPAAYLRLRADIVTSTAELRTIDLDDGSRVRVGPQSAIGIAFSEGERRVHLLRGGAFFEVAPDARRPFRVVAEDVVTTVLGTAFEVALQEDGVAVAVQRGNVRVDKDSLSPPLSADLKAGDWIRVGMPLLAERGTKSPQDIGDWTAGQFVARNRPIAEIVDRLRGYYGGMIVVQDAAFSRRLVNGVYDLRDPEATLRNLASAHDAVVRQISPWMLLVTAR
ncbi:MAG: FecR domain-containing protein [Reyranella sp.]|jgi:transmembrane sensor|uniref:FecR family protein n=1 Tax=Reyranella sp. TaxID=1929291 RepID=UPI0025D121FB|nr:FecR domain-containing protein [Reyranella sp.]MBR2815482.1 FecR domain-containing protein [Reyranella sp.]